jgi:cellulose synthase (UDP-forming)
MKASFYALLGIKVHFGITPKEGANVLSFRYLIPQLLASLACIFALIWGLQRLYYERELIYAIIVNMIWTLYNFITVSFFLYFNHVEEEQIINEI